MSSSPDFPEPRGDDGAAMAGRFHDVAERILDALLEDDPEWASELGDHRFAHRLRDHSAEAVTVRVGVLSDALSALDEIDDTLLAAPDAVDLELLRTRVTSDMWRLTELRPRTWDPLEHLPDTAFYELIARATLPMGERLAALAARCEALPGFLATARDVLTEGPGMPRVHVETAVSQTRGLGALLGEQVDALLESEPTLRTEVEAARRTAQAALSTHAEWLESSLDTATADPRLGARVYAAQLWYTLDSELAPDTLLTRAESDLIAIEEELAEVVAAYDGRPRFPGQVREVLDRLAADAPVDGETIADQCERTLEHLSRRTAEADLVTVSDQLVRLVTMPEARRGIAAAYCDPTGPLAQPTGEPTLVAVSPTPADWSAERAASFYREYNGHMLRNLMAHEAVPGHALQLAHACAYQGATRVRKAIWSGPFVEGWAVYAEELLATVGWDGSGGETDLALRLCRLKMQLRTTLNAILDVRVHAYGIGESEAMEMLLERGHQEEGEAAGKWRRAQLTSAQLATYYVGYREISDLVRDLAAARPEADQRELHDELLAHGSPPPRHLRTLLGL